jgi:hypothetical protein
VGDTHTQTDKPTFIFGRLANKIKEGERRLLRAFAGYARPTALEVEISGKNCKYNQ